LPTQSLKTSPTLSRSSLARLVLLTLSAAFPLFGGPPETLQSVATRDVKVIRRWTLAGDPRGVAIGADGTIYVGLAKPQAVIAINSGNGTVTKRIVLDSAEIASTKELVTLRTNAERTRLYIANGSDESATIMSLPDMAVLREITMEGEAIRDALPDPRGRYLYLVGRRVHVFDKDGQTELRTLNIDDPMAIATTSTGGALAVVATEDFGNAKATSVALFDTTTWAEITRDPLQTDQHIDAAMFAPDDTALVALNHEYLYEKPVTSRKASAVMTSGSNGTMRMKIDFGDLVNSDRVCLPESFGPQIATFLGNANTLAYAERRCSASGHFAGSSRRVSPASIYGISAYAIAHDPLANTIVATDPAGFLTIYKVPRAAVAR